MPTVTVKFPIFSAVTMHSNVFVSFASSVTFTDFTTSPFTLKSIVAFSVAFPVFFTVAVIVTFSPTYTLSGETETSTTSISAAATLKSSAEISKLRSCLFPFIFHIPYFSAHFLPSLIL